MEQFKDFTPEQLVGKIVLRDTNQSREITTIISATKTRFKIKSTPDITFSIDSGKKCGQSDSRMNWGSWDNCELISLERANELKHQWAIKREHKKLVGFISTKLSKLTIETLKKIEKIIIENDGE